MVPETRTINGHSLDADVVLDASDVGALPDTTVIPDTSTFVQNDQWASDIKGGIMKQRLDAGTSTLFLSFDGTDV